MKSPKEVPIELEQIPQTQSENKELYLLYGGIKEKAPWSQLLETIFGIIFLITGLSAGILPPPVEKFCLLSKTN